MRRTSSTAMVLSLLALLASLANNAAAQTSAEELKQRIQERSNRIKEYRALLTDPDQTVRLAALDVMLKSDDIAMRELAYQMGFASADETMRAVTLKNRISDLKTILVKIEEKSNPSKTEKKALTQWGGAYTFDVSSFDEKTGNFKTESSAKRGRGQVAGTAFEFTHRYCNGTFRLGDEPVLVGELTCKGSWAGEFSGRISLQ